MESKPSKCQIRNLQSKIAVKTAASGRITRNPFLNFLRDYRKSNKANVKLTELTRRGAQLWRGMSEKEKSPYVNISKQAPKYKQTRRRGRRRRRRRRRGRRRSRSRSGSSSMASRHVKRRKKKRKFKTERHTERNTDKATAGGVGEDCNATTSKKACDDYEVKFKNSRYEDNRDFI